MRVSKYIKATSSYAITYAITYQKRARALMTKQQLVETKETITVAVQPTLSKRLADMIDDPIDDPIGSVIIATATTTLAIISMLSGMWIVHVILY